MTNNTLIVVAGPTASGKTVLAINLALQLNTEIISADSRIVYREFNIGTAKPSEEELSLVQHHLIDIVDPAENYTAALFQEDATKIIKQLHEKGKIPVIAGGTGFYIRAITDGLNIPHVKPDEDYRNELKEKAEVEGSTALYNMLSEIDPASAGKLHHNDIYRIIRALEVYKQTGKPISELQTKSPDKYNLVYTALNTEDRQVLYNRINERVLSMIEYGLIEEVKSLLGKYGKSLSVMKTIGYKEVVSFLEGEISFEQMIEDIQKNTRHFAKRQLIWFRPDNRIKWYNIDREGQEEIILDIMKKLEGNE